MAALRVVKENTFEPKMPDDLSGLPVNLIWKGKPDYVEYVGFRAFPGAVKHPIKQVLGGEEQITGWVYDEGRGKVEEVADINGTLAEAYDALEESVIPRIRELFGVPLMVPANGKSDGPSVPESASESSEIAGPKKKVGRPKKIVSPEIVGKAIEEESGVVESA